MRQAMHTRSGRGKASCWALAERAGFTMAAEAGAHPRATDMSRRARPLLGIRNRFVLSTLGIRVRYLLRMGKRPGALPLHDRANV
jgi:hypothetical protein